MNAASLTIRKAIASDAQAIYDIYQYYRDNTAVSLNPVTPSLIDCENLINSTVSTYPFLVAEMEGVIVGFTYCKPYRAEKAFAWSVETRIYVDKDALEQGVGTALHQTLENICKTQGICNLYLCITYSAEIDKYRNDTSLVFHEKMGYRKEGEFENCGYKDGHWFSQYWMQKNINRHQSNPASVVPFSELTPDQLHACGVK